MKYKIFFYLLFFVIMYFMASQITFAIRHPTFTDTQRMVHFKEIITFQRVKLDPANPANLNNDGSLESEYQRNVIDDN